MTEMINLQAMIFLLVGVGFVLNRLNIIDKHGSKCLTDLVIDVVLPCNIIKAFCMDFSTQMGEELLWIVLLSLGLQIFAVIYGKLLFSRESEGQSRCLKYATICSNAGFLGNPIAEGVFGAYGLLLAQFFLIPQRIMMWSEGIAVFSGESNPKETTKKVITHPCILACGIGLVLMLTGYRFPEPIAKTISCFGSCNTALSMLVIGVILGGMNLATLLDIKAWVFTLHRLVILPLIVYVITGFLPVSATVRGLTVLLTAMPAGATTSILAAKYEMEPEFATKLVIVSTLLSMPTLAIWSAILV